jgi:hypothetical protein
MSLLLVDQPGGNESDGSAQNRHSHPRASAKENAAERAHEDENPAADDSALHNQEHASQNKSDGHEKHKPEQHSAATAINESAGFRLRRARRPPGR